MEATLQQQLDAHWQTKGLPTVLENLNQKLQAHWKVVGFLGSATPDKGLVTNEDKLGKAESSPLILNETLNIPDRLGIFGGHNLEATHLVRSETFDRIRFIEFSKRNSTRTYRG